MARLGARRCSALLCSAVMVLLVLLVLVVVLVEGDVSGSPGSLCEPHQSFSFPGLHTGDMLQAAKKGDGVCVSL